MSDRITGDVACIDKERTPTTLIATNGYHCLVWRSTAILMQGGGRVPVDFVIKKPREHTTLRETQILNKDYQTLRAALGDIVPEAVFVATRVDGQEDMIVIAETINAWFNIANPINEAEAVPLLRKLPKAQLKLERFLRNARRWHERDGKIIDLYGLDNLVLDKNREVKYMDSFRVFFYEDLLTICDEEDNDLREKIELSLQRRDYLEFILTESRLCRLDARPPPPG